MKTGFFKQRSVAGVFFFMTMLFSPGPALGLDATALPTGGTITSGTGSIRSGGSSMTVNQASQKIIANWDTFNIGKDASVTFNQPGSTACALNRINDQSASRIMGRLTANGRVFLINPSGIIFGQSAQVNVGGLVASALDITDSDFLNDTYIFSNNGSTGAVTNAGTINAGFAAFLSPIVDNSGTVVADGGTAAMASGNRVSLDLTGDGLITFTIDAGAVDAQVSNSGLIKAGGGLVYLSAEAADELTSAAVNNTGIIRAQTLSGKEGKILLMADMDTGTVTVGGTLDASAPDGGDGGFIETSAASVQIAHTANVTTVAKTGETGTWLIDPTDFTIAVSGGDMTGTQVEAALAANNVTIKSADGNTQGEGNIYVNDTISWTSNTLTLSAYKDIEINSTLTAAGTGTGLTLIHGTGNSDGTYRINAPVNLESDSVFKTRGPDDPDVKTYTIITTLDALQGIDSGDLAGNYVLGRDLSAVSGGNFNPIGGGGNPFTGIFDGLGHTISDLYINRPTGEFVGLFGYSKGRIRNVGLIDADVTGRSEVGGLAGYVDSGSITNSYVSGSVSGKQYVGGLAGWVIYSSISSSYATGSVSGDVDVGGLVGRNGGGSITDSYATASVSSLYFNVGGLVGASGGSITNSYATGSVEGDNYVGGLVGYNYGSITGSYATGSVSAASDVGGLVGTNYGSITSSGWNSASTGQASGIGDEPGSPDIIDISGNEFNLDFYKNTLGWDIDDEGGTGSVWRIYDGHTYPLLRCFLTELSTLTREYNGLTTLTGAILASDAGVFDETLLVDKTNDTSLTQGTINAAGTNAAAYGIDLSGYYSTQQGYDIVSSASLVITPKTLTISGTTAADKTYDGTTAAVITPGILSGLVGSETLGVTGTGFFDSKDAGFRTATASYTLSDGENGGLAANYTLADTTGSAAIITPAPLTVTANDGTKAYDGTAFSGGYGVTGTGFATGDDVSALSGTLAYTGTSQGAKDIGTYTIMPAGLSSGNYTITFAGAQLTITENGAFEAAVRRALNTGLNGIQPPEENQAPSYHPEDGLIVIE